MTNAIAFDIASATPAGQEALAAYKTVSLAGSAGVVPMVRMLTNVYTVDHAKDICRWLAEQEAAAQSKATNTIVKATEPTKERFSEMTGFFKAAEHNSFAAFLSQLEPLKPSLSRMVLYCNWFRLKSGTKKDATEAPSTNDVIEAFNSKKEEKAKPKLEGVDKVKASPLKAFIAAKETLAHLQTIEGEGEGAPFLLAAMQALQSYAPRIGKLQALANASEQEEKLAKQLADAGMGTAAPVKPTAVKARKAKGVK